MKYELPKELRRRNMNYTFKNGILEVVLEKWAGNYL
jgi:HSP20 family molecular chaperone IbpA